MTNTEETLIQINLSEASFTIKGAEDFVSKYLPEIQAFLTSNLNAVQAIKTVQAHVDPVTIVSNADAVIGNPKNKYIDAGIYYVDTEDNSIHILKNVPGKTKATKSRNIALIALYAKNDKISNMDIIDLCIKHACYDAPNFSSAFKSKDGIFIRKGDGRNWTLELTIPGKAAAEKILDEMLG